jgi:hypothetical protein
MPICKHCDHEFIVATADHAVVDNAVVETVNVKRRTNE